MRRRRAESYSVYLITNNVNNMCYVGCSSDPERRFREHKGYKDRILGSAMDEFGIDNFSMDILGVFSEVEEGKCFERECIDKYNSLYPFGYNFLRAGGQSGPLSEDTKDKLRRKQTGRKTHTEEHKIELKKIMSGEGNNFYGKKHTEETKLKMRTPVRNKTTGVVYSSSKEAARAYGGTNGGNITSVCSGKGYGNRNARKTAFGCEWEYAGPRSRSPSETWNRNNL